MRQPLEKIFSSKTRAKVLGWFYMHTDESFFVRQLANILEEDSTNLSRELSNLERAGILSSARQGNLKYFRVNRKCPFSDELKGLVLKTVGIIGELKSSLDKKQDIKYAFIYGSYAKGEEKAESDLDLMIVGDMKIDEIDSLISRIEKRLGRSINYVIYSNSEFINKKKKKDGFIMDVLKDKKLMLIGDESGLKKA